MPEKTDKNSLTDQRYYGVGSFIVEIIKIVVLAFFIIAPSVFLSSNRFFVQGSMEPNLKIINIWSSMNSVTNKPRFFVVWPSSLSKNCKDKEVVVFRYPKNPSQFFHQKNHRTAGRKSGNQRWQSHHLQSSQPQRIYLGRKRLSLQRGAHDRRIGCHAQGRRIFCDGPTIVCSVLIPGWGPVPQDKIIGKVFFRAWPLNEIKIY